MGTTLSPTNVCNGALALIGAAPINSLLDTTNNSSIQCNNNFNLAYLAVTRAARWNCLLQPSNPLPQIPQTPIAGSTVAPPASYANWTALTPYTIGQYLYYGGQYYTVINSYTSSTSFATDLGSGNIQVYNTNGAVPTTALPWAPFTQYQANAFLTYGNYYYTVNFAYTSTINFTNDLTSGYLVQTDQQAGSSVSDAFATDGSQYASGWAYQYQLPADFQLLAILNETAYWDFEGAGGDDYEIMGQYLFCDSQQAIIQYVPNQPDTTQWDSMFTDAVQYKLASVISTPLRQDGGALAQEMLTIYNQALTRARQKNGGEAQSRRYSPIRSSRWNRARYFSAAN